MFKKLFIGLLLILLIIGLFLFSSSSKKIISPRVENKINQTINKVEEIKENIAPEPTKISSKGLPTKHLIKTSFVEQAPEKNWSEPWQDACEEAALLTISYFYKDINPSLEQIKNDILTLIDYENQKEMSTSINVFQMETITKDYFHLNSKIIENPTIDQIKEFISKNIPIIAPTSGKILFKENPYFNDNGPYYHNIVIVGYDDSKNQFIVNDVGTRRGQNFHYSYDLIMTSIHDFPDSKQKEDINLGAKRILLLLK